MGVEVGWEPAKVKAKVMTGSLQGPLSLPVPQAPLELRRKQ
jgi:hypothetical protein